MKITALAPWFGSKRYLAPRIVEALGPHRCYWEPFCGSMAVLLAKQSCSQETVNDLHGDLINLARVIHDDRRCLWLYRKLRRTLVHEDVQARAKLQLLQDFDPDASEPDCDRAWAFFVASWLGRNGTIGTKEHNNSFCVRYTANGGIQGTRFVSAVDSIPAWRRRLRNVTILRRNGFDLLERIEDAPGTAIYCDPPYLTKGATYVHDFTSADHDRLAQLLARFQRARVVLSYYADPRLDVLYPGWRQLRCDVAKSLVNQGKRGSGGKVMAPEVLLINQPAEPKGLFA